MTAFYKIYEKNFKEYCINVWVQLYKDDESFMNICIHI